MISNNLIRKNRLTLHKLKPAYKLELPLIESKIPAGFPSPADDYLEMSLDLNEKLIRNPSSTFFAQITGSSMENAGIHDGDIIIVDKSLQPKNDSILVCSIDGEFTLKRFKRVDNETGYLIPDNPKFKPIKVTQENNFMIWGVVTYSIHKH